MLPLRMKRSFSKIIGSPEEAAILIDPGGESAPHGVNSPVIPVLIFTIGRAVDFTISAETIAGVVLRAGLFCPSIKIAGIEYC
jgi:hypothetical protein